MAQSVPPPRVVSAAFMAGNGEPGEPFGRLRVTFSKPMATSLSTCKQVTGEGCYEIIESKLDQLEVQAVADAGFEDDSIWINASTEETRITSPVKSLFLQINTAELGCTEAEKYQSEDGQLLTPFEATLYTEDYCDGCEPSDIIIESKIDVIP